MSDQTIQELLDVVRGEIPSLFRVCESIAMLDMIASFGQLVVCLPFCAQFLSFKYDFSRVLTSNLIDFQRRLLQTRDHWLYCHQVWPPSSPGKGDHYPKEQVFQSDRYQAHKEKYIPNDVYASQQTRFQIITGCNMSGKSTYIRSVALMSVMAQVGCFVPASYASFTMIHQLFARVSMDDSIEANVSTFASEMRETAFILRYISTSANLGKTNWDN